MAKDDSLLIAGLKEGDKAVFTQIYHKYSDGLFSLAHRYVKDYDLAEDILQQVFLQLWKSHEEITISKDLGNYLFKMTKNCVLKEIQEQNSRVLDAYELEYWYTTLGTPKPGADSVEEGRLKAVYRMMEKLPPKTKNVFLMKIYENLSDEDIADRLGLSRQTVKNHYTQALKFMRRHLLPKNLLLLLELTLIFLHNA